jgi:hypothetical protein
MKMMLHARITELAWAQVSITDYKPVDGQNKTNDQGTPGRKDLTYIGKGIFNLADQWRILTGAGRSSSEALISNPIISWHAMRR